MSRILVKVVDRSPGEIRVQTRAGCDGCGSACHRPRTWRLPEMAGSQLVVHVNPAQHVELTIHSLVLPLLGFVGGAALASGLAPLNDLAALGMSLLGLLVGVLFCRALPADTINVYEASPNE